MGVGGWVASNTSTGSGKHTNQLDHFYTAMPSAQWCEVSRCRRSRCRRARGGGRPKGPGQLPLAHPGNSRRQYMGSHPSKERAASGPRDGASRARQSRRNTYSKTTSRLTITDTLHGRVANRRRQHPTAKTSSTSIMLQQKPKSRSTL